MENLATIAALIITHKAWGNDFLSLADHFNAAHGLSTDTKEIGEAWDMFLSHVS
jgi:hypothetical protein